MKTNVQKAKMKFTGGEKMKSLFIDYPDYFYAEDTENKIIKKSARMRGSMEDTVKDAITILESDLDIKIVKVDISGTGLAVAEKLEQELVDSDVRIERYRFRAL